MILVAGKKTTDAGTKMTATTTTTAMSKGDAAIIPIPSSPEPSQTRTTMNRSLGGDYDPETVSFVVVV